MRTPSGTFATAIASETTTIARLWTITRGDGEIYHLTDHDMDILKGADTFKAEPGFTASALLSVLGADVQGLTMSVPFSDAGITEADVNARLFDKAQCRIEAVDWTAPDAGSMFLFGGEIRSVEIEGIVATILVAGVLSSDRRINVENYSGFCRADLGDARCKFDIGSLRETFTIATVTSAMKFLTDELNQADEFWTLGVLRFTSGNNVGVSIEVRKSTSATKSIELFLPSPFVMAPGDEGEIWPGCDKSPRMCDDRYDNMTNYRGENFAIPPSAAET